MTPDIAPFPAFQTFIDVIRERFSASFSGYSMSADTYEDTRNRRQFIHEVLNRNPDAFSGDLDVQSMMQIYPSQI